MVSSLPVLGLLGCATVQKHTVISADDVRICCTVQGEGDPALVFVHGWSCDKSYWEAQEGHFAENHKVVMVDLAGHGESGLDRKEWTIEAFGKDVAAVVKKLGLDRVILIGHSMGGPVITAAARQMPGRVIGLVGVDTFHNVEEEVTKERLDRFTAPFKEDFKEATRKFVRRMFPADADPALVERVVSDMASAPPDIGITAFEALFNYEMKAALKDARVPIYCINSDRYPTDVEAGRRHAMPFELKLMPGIGHFVMMEDPETFNRLLMEVISETAQ
jgi:pimeloyl-ACP methyl ester carboxylesterase